MKRLLPLFAIVLSGALMAGCDSIAGALGVDKVEVPLSAVGSLAVNGTSVSVESGSGSRSGGKLPNVFDIESIEVDPADVTFTPSSSKNAAVSGNVYVSIFMGSGATADPLGSATITITNNVATAVTETIGTVISQIQQRCAAPTSGCPAPSTYSGRNVSDIKNEIETYLRTSTSIAYTIVVTADQGVSGTITVSDITVNLDF